MSSCLIPAAVSAIWHCCSRNDWRTALTATIAVGFVPGSLAQDHIQPGLALMSEPGALVFFLAQRRTLLPGKTRSLMMQRSTRGNVSANHSCCHCLCSDWITRCSVVPAFRISYSDNDWLSDSIWAPFLGL